MNDVKSVAQQHNDSLKHLYSSFDQHHQLIIKNLEKQDFNRDGQLNIDGFQGALRLREVDLTNQQLSEAFYLICERS